MGYCWRHSRAGTGPQRRLKWRVLIRISTEVDSPSAAGRQKIRAKVLALHGADDPYAPADQVAAFEQEMRGAGIGLAVAHLWRRGTWF